METAAICNRVGFTLIEFLVAIVILMVGLLGLLQTVNYALSHNLSNQLRQEALMMADERMNVQKSKPFALISTTPAPYVHNDSVQRAINNGFQNYSVVTSNSDLTNQSKHIDIQVIWRHKGTRYNHSMSSLVSEYE